MINVKYHTPAFAAPPVMIAEFEGVPRYSLQDSDRFLAKIGPGEYYATRNGELITTTLGSCVAACVRNRETGIGGMNHFMLPDFHRGDAWEQTLVSSSARYGSVAMERLINLVLGDHQRRQDLEVKVFGGARVLRANIDIGERNVSFVRSYLMTEGLSVAAEDLGGTRPRKIIYDPLNGDVFVRHLGRGLADQIVDEEIRHAKLLSEEPCTGEIDLFLGDEWESI